MNGMAPWDFFCPLGSEGLTRFCLAPDFSAWKGGAGVVSSYTLLLSVLPGNLTSGVLGLAMQEQAVITLTRVFQLFMGLGASCSRIPVLGTSRCSSALSCKCSAWSRVCNGPGALLWSGPSAPPPPPLLHKNPSATLSSPPCQPYPHS